MIDLGMRIKLKARYIIIYNAFMNHFMYAARGRRDEVRDACHMNTKTFGVIQL